MVSFTQLLLAAGVAICSLGTPVKNTIADKSIDAPLLEKRGLPTGTGTNGGFFYSWYSDNPGSHIFNGGPNGQYSVSWSGPGNFVGGKGWRVGSARTITFRADFRPTNNGNAYLTVYGWLRSSLVEYYILENHGEYNPCSGKRILATFNSDGSDYDVCTNTRTNAPSIEGIRTFEQYISVRKAPRSSGSVTTANHFNKWRSLGLKVGTFDYQIMATEGYNSAGSSSVTVS